MNLKSFDSLKQNETHLQYRLCKMYNGYTNTLNCHVTTKPHCWICLCITT